MTRTQRAVAPQHTGVSDVPARWKSRSMPRSPTRNSCTIRCATRARSLAERGGQGADGPARAGRPPPRRACRALSGATKPGSPRTTHAGARDPVRLRHVRNAAVEAVSASPTVRLVAGSRRRSGFAAESCSPSSQPTAPELVLRIRRMVSRRGRPRDGHARSDRRGRRRPTSRRCRSPSIRPSRSAGAASIGIPRPPR